MTLFSLRRSTLLISAALALASILALALLTWRVSSIGALNFPLSDPATQTSQFYPSETSTDGVEFSWSRASSGLLLPAISWRQMYTIEMLFPVHPAEEVAGQAQLLAGDKQQLLEPQPGWADYSIAARSQWGVSNSLALAPASGDYTFYPGSGDDRRLGAAVRAVRVEAVPQFGGLSLPAPLLLIFALAWPWLVWVDIYSVRGRLRPALAAIVAAVFVLLVWLPAPAALPGLFIAATVLLGLISLAVLLLSYPPVPKLALLLSFARRYDAWLVTGIYTLLGVVTTWPLVARIGGVLPGWPADNFAFLYKVWWLHSALQNGVSPFFDPNVYYPFGFFFGRGEPTWPNILPAALLAFPFGDAAGYNIVLLLSFPLSGLGTYLLARELTGSRKAALLAGLIFALAPYRMAQIAGHLQMAATGPIPLTFYFVERALHTRKPRSGALAGLFFALTVLTAWYYAVITAIGLLIYVPLRLLSARNKKGTALASSPTSALRPLLSALSPLIAFVLVSGILSAPALALALEAQRESPLGHSAKAADENSASPQDYVIPNQLHPFWGETFMSAHAEQNIIEDGLYLGVVPLLLCIVALTRRRHPAAPALFFVGVVAFVLSLGLTLHSPTGPVKLGEDLIPLPAQLPYYFAPGFSGIRAYARFGVLVALAVALLAALGYSSVVSGQWSVVSAAARQGVQRLGLGRLLFGALLLGVLVDFWPAPYAWGVSVVKAPAVAGWIAEQPGDFAVFQAPLESAISGPALFAGTFYRKRLAYGYETFEPLLFESGRADLRSFPDEPAIELLKSWNVRYVVVDGNAYGADWPGFRGYLDTLPALRRAYSAVQEPIYSGPLWVADARPELSTYFAPSEQVVYELR